MATTRLMPLHIGEGRSFSTAALVTPSAVRFSVSLPTIMETARRAPGWLCRKSRENRLWETDLWF